MSTLYNKALEALHEAGRYPREDLTHEHANNFAAYADVDLCISVIQDPKPTYTDYQRSISVRALGVLYTFVSDSDRLTTLQVLQRCLYDTSVEVRDTTVSVLWDIYELTQDGHVRHVIRSCLEHGVSHEDTVLVREHIQDALTVMTAGLENNP